MALALQGVILFMKSIIVLALFVLGSSGVHSSCIFQELNTSFYNLAHTKIDDFTITQYHYTANFSGGLVRMSGDVSQNFEEYYWAVLPSGETAEGISDGAGLISLDPPAEVLSALIQAGVDAQARVQLIGEADNIISEYSLLNGEALYIDILRDDEVPLISAISVIVDGGTDEMLMLMDSFNYHNASSNEPCNDNPSVEGGGGGIVGGGSFSTLWLAILFGALIIYKIIAVAKKRYTYKLKN